MWFGLIVGFVIIGQLPHDLTAPHVGGALVVLLIALAPAIQAATSLPFEVTLSDDELCEFRSLLRRRRVRVQRIRSMSSDEDDIYIRYDHGKIHLVAVSDFKHLLTKLVELNPAIKVDGWLRGALDGEVASTTRATGDG